MTDSNIEYVSWNTALLSQQISNGLSEAEFIKQGLLEGQYKDFSEKDQIALLTYVYRSIKDAMTIIRE